MVKQVALTPRDSPNRQTVIKILWHTGATTELIAERLTRAQKISTPTQVIEAIKELAPGRIDREIAQLLNQRGLVTGTGRPFTQASVNWIRSSGRHCQPSFPSSYWHSCRWSLLNFGSG